MNIVTSPYAIQVRPHHLETEASYTARLLAANFETEAHQRALLRAAKNAAPSLPHPMTWADILTAKTGRQLHLTRPATPATTKAEDHSCQYCPNFAKTRTACLFCTRGARVTQATPFDAPICVHHARWVGPTPDVRIDIVQPTLDETRVRAGIRFNRLRSQGRMTPALYEILRSATRPRKFAVPFAELDAETLPLVVAIAGAVTTQSFVTKLFAPGTSYATAYRHLETTITKVTSATTDDITLALWAYFKPSFWALRHAIRTRSAYQPAWEHDYAVPTKIADAYIAAYSSESFENYLAVRKGPAMEPDAHDILDRGGMTICAKGHQVKIAKHCPVCKNSQVAPGYNDLATVNPTVALQLDPVLNGTTTAQTVAAATHKDLAWRCPRAGHVYWATGSNRTQAGQNCGICSGRTVVPGINDITTTHPTIAAEIHPDYAKGHPPARISAGSEIKPEWLCPTCGRTYKMTAYERTHSEGCDPCRRARLRASKDNLTATHPDVAAQWHPSRNNGPGPEEYSHGSNEEVYWLCQTSAAHWYKQRIDRKVAGYGCSLCSSRKLVLRVNDLATTDPLLVMEFHPTLNGAKKPELMFAGNESYYWKCLAAGHVRKQNVPNRRKSRGCTDCERVDRILA